MSVTSLPVLGGSTPLKVTLGGLTQTIVPAKISQTAPKSGDKEGVTDERRKR